MDENQIWLNREELPVETPQGWYGGSVEEDPIGQLYRRWRNVESDLENCDEENITIIEYSDQFDRVELSIYNLNRGRYIKGETLVTRTVPESEATDKRCAKVATEMMQVYS